MLGSPSIKSALYAYDQDQTYDLLWASNIHNVVSTLIANTLGSHYLFNNGIEYMPVCLIERFTPITYPWAEHWTTQNLEFLKALSKTGLFNNPLASGTAWGFPGQCNFDISTDLNLPNFPEEITLTLEPNQEIVISWLAHAHTELSPGDIHPDYRQKCLVFNKNYRVIKSYDKSVTVSLNTNGWLINSLVISDSSKITIEEETNLILYEDLENTLEGILLKLNLYCQVLVSFDMIVYYRLKMGNLDPAEQYYHDFKTYFLEPEYGNPVYDPLPDWYYFASLIYANNNYWNNGEIHLDLGKPITVLTRDYWTDALIIDLVIWYLGEQHWDTGASITLECPNYGEALTWNLEYAINTNNYSPSLDFQKDIQSYELSDFHRGRLSIGRVNDYEFENGYSYTRALRKDRKAEGIGAARWFVTPSDPNNYLGSGLWHRWTGIHLATLMFPYRISEHLINETESYIFHPRLTALLYDPYTVNINQRSFTEDGGRLFKDETLIKVQFKTSQVNGHLTPEISLALIEKYPEQIPVSNNYGHDYLQIYGFLYDEVFWETLTLKNKFWADPPVGVEVYNSEYISTIVDSLLYQLPESEDYIMADSIRVKEIHAALRADKFANDDNNPDNSRIANLGYYIERIARVLGISVNSDGSIRSIRQSRLVKQGDNIPAGWILGQWGRNQGGNSQGQKGGIPEEDRDGLAYELRTNNLEIDPRSGNPKAITQGGYVLVENLPQLLHVILDDLDRGLGLQASGANVLPSADGKSYISYQGLHALLAEAVYMLSAISQDTRQNLVSNLITQAVGYEILGAFGLPIGNKEFEAGIDKEKLQIPYPGLAEGSPSLYDMFTLVLANLAPIIASIISVDLILEFRLKKQSGIHLNCL